MLSVPVAPVMAAGSGSTAASSAEQDLGWSYQHEFDETDGGNSVSLALHDRFILSLPEASSSESDEHWIIVSHPGLVIRDEAVRRVSGNYKHFWFVEAAGAGSHEFSLNMVPSDKHPDWAGFDHYALSVLVNPGEWNITTVDDTGSGSLAGAYPSLRIDPSGTPRISYYSYRYGKIMYGELQGSTWNLSPVADSDGTYSTSLALAPSGYPAISFGDGVHYGNLMYAERNGTLWNVQELDRGNFFETVDSNDNILNNGSAIGDAGEYSSLAFDGKGNPHITYNDGRYFGSLEYITRDGSVWHTQNKDGWHDKSVDTDGWTGNTGFSSSLAIGPAGELHVAYTDRTYYGNLMYAEFNASSWTNTGIDNGGSKTSSTGYNPSLALDYRGYPHISYYDKSASTLRYASWNGTAWTLDTIDATNDVGAYSSLAIGGSDEPQISYYDASYRELRYATYDGMSSQWVIRTVDTDGDVGSHTSIALDPSGHPDIAYYDATNHALKFARWIG
jgi:hypothetical protein